MKMNHSITLAAFGAAATLCAPNTTFAGSSGACCLPDETCVQSPSMADCNASGGLYLGDNSGCASAVCESVPFNFNLSPGSTSANLPQFDDAGGSLNLVKAALGINAQINADVALVNISMAQFIFDTTVTYDGELTVNLAPLSEIVLVVDPPPFDCGLDVILGPGESCDFGGPLVFPAPPGMTMASDPPADLSALVGNGTIPALIEGNGIFAYQGGVPFTIAVSVHNVAGTARIAYLYEAKPGACCLPDGTCVEVTLVECTAQEGLWTINTPCSQIECGGACCLDDGSCTDSTSEAECDALFGDWQGQFSTCDDETCPGGACCLDDGSCLDDLSQANCEGLSGTYQGLNSLCADIGDTCCVGSIGDFIWDDTNGDGIQDDGETGLPDIVVILSLKLDDGGTVFLADATTDANGFYEFTGLCAGEYQLEIDPTSTPPGYEASPPNEGTDDTVDSDCDGGMVMISLLTDDTNDDTNDCGFTIVDDCEVECAVEFVIIPDVDDDDDDDEGDDDDSREEDDDDVDDDDDASEASFAGDRLATGDDDDDSGDDDDDDEGPGGEELLKVSYTASDSCFSVDAIIDIGCDQILVESGQLIRLTCATVRPPDDDDDTSGEFECDQKITGMTMIWDGTDPVRIRAYDGDTDDTLLADIDDIQVGDAVTVSGMEGPNNVYWEVFFAGSDKLIGLSEFHRSCSDDDMDGPEDCGKRQGNGKSDDEDLLNDWILEGLLDGSGSFFGCSTMGGFALTGDDEGDDDDDDDQTGPSDCSWSFDGDVLVIESESAVFIVTATNNAGETTTCEIDLCAALEGDSMPSLELSSMDVGPDPAGFVPGPGGYNPIDALRLLNAGDMLTLVDQSDDDGLGQEWCEALYVHELVVADGATLLTNGCPVYYADGEIAGDVDEPANVIRVDLAPPCPADVNGSGAVDFADLNALMTAWGACVPGIPCVQDIDGSGDVGFTDLTMLLFAWGTCPE